MTTAAVEKHQKPASEKFRPDGVLHLLTVYLPSGPSLLRGLDVRVWSLQGSPLKGLELGQVQGCAPWSRSGSGLGSVGGAAGSCFFRHRGLARATLPGPPGEAESIP